MGSVRADHGAFIFELKNRMGQTDRRAKCVTCSRRRPDKNDKWKPQHESQHQQQLSLVSVAFSSSYILFTVILAVILECWTYSAAWCGCWCVKRWRSRWSTSSRDCWISPITSIALRPSTVWSLTLSITSSGLSPAFSALPLLLTCNDNIDQRVSEYKYAGYFTGETI